VFVLGMNYAQLLEKTAKVKREHPKYLAGQVYEAVRARDMPQKKSRWLDFFRGLLPKRAEASSVEVRPEPRNTREKDAPKNRIPFSRDNKTI